MAANPSHDPRDELKDDSQSFLLLEDCLSQLQRGEQPDRARLEARHPELAGALDCLELLDAFAAPISHDALLAGSSSVDGDHPTVESSGSASRPSRGHGLRVPAAIDRGEFGQYEILEEIGRGGMGVVFKAKQKSLDRFVALKMISGVSVAGDRLRRFYTEAKAAAALTHPHVVGIYEVGQAFGHHYLAMEYVAGRSLADRLKDGPPPVEEAAEIICSVAYAVHHLHEQDVVHRDLKPSNILLDEHGKPHVTDFGLAKVFADEAEKADDTATGVIAGTPPYMSPEQASGQTERVGPLSDVYSLGAILYEMLTGRPPFREKNPLETLMAVREREPPSPRSLQPKTPRELEIICLKCLEKSPGDRYASARELAQDLERFLRREGIEAQPPSVWQRLSRWSRRKPALATRLMGIGVFHSVQWVNYFNGVVDFAFHWKASLVLVVWVLLSFVFQQVLDGQRYERAARYFWGLTDVCCLTVILLLADGIASPLIVCLPLLVVASGLWFEERLVWFVTLTTCAAYLVLLADYFARGSEIVISPRPGADRHIYFLLALTISGGIVAYQVSRVQALNKYLAKSRLR
jgi:serine/threonine-protein kinase